MKFLKLLLLAGAVLGAALTISRADGDKAKADCKACCEKKASCTECCSDKCDGCCKKEEKKDDKKCCSDDKKADGGKKCDEHAEKDCDKK